MPKKHHREIIILLGKPGSGKGTQAEPLARAMGLPFVSMGKMLRDEIKKGTKIGKEAAAGVAKGQLIPNYLTIILLRRRLTMPDAARGIIIDGFPRDLEQAMILDKIAHVRHAILISITDKEVVRRISGRRICSVCGQNYHVEAFKPKKPGICDKCGGRIVHRDDDKKHIIKERLVSYREDTIPVLRFYRRKRVLRRVDAQAGIIPVGKKILEVIEKADA